MNDQNLWELVEIDCFSRRNLFLTLITEDAVEKFRSELVIQKINNVISSVDRGEIQCNVEEPIESIVTVAASLTNNIG